MDQATAPRCDDAAVHAYGVTLEAMTRLNRIFDRRLKDLCGISQSWFEALLRIERSGGYMTMGELGEQIALTSGGVTRLVDRLIEQGYADRQACPEDRRVLYVAITDQGRAKLAEALDVHLADLHTEFIDRMSESELETVTSVMDRLRSSPHS